jgi:hypothetical protein
VTSAPPKLNSRHRGAVPQGSEDILDLSYTALGIAVEEESATTSSKKWEQCK